MSKVLVDLSTVLSPRKPLADSTLNNMRKSDLIQYIRELERAHDIAVAWNIQQADNVKDWQPVKYGHWQNRTFFDGKMLSCECSVCHTRVCKEYKSCPECRSIMVKEKSSNGR